MHSTEFDLHGHMPVSIEPIWNYVAKKNSFACGCKQRVRNRLASNNADKAETTFDITLTPKSDKI
jgi:hypothetical protein